MRKATRIAAASFGFVAGIAGLEHGYFEILQGNISPASLMFASNGPPCVPEIAWNACEPAMTVLPNLLISGILTVVIALAIMTWSAGFIQRKHGGSVLIGLSILLLLVGGGFFPPIIGIAAGAAGTQINKPLDGRQPPGITRLAARLWPWPMVIYMAWVVGQYVIGSFYNDFLKSIMGYGVLLILILLPVSIYSGYSYDAAQRNEP